MGRMSSSEENEGESYHGLIIPIGINRSSYYTSESHGVMSFQNPLHTEQPVQFEMDVLIGTDMRLKDFLASIPLFADFSEQQLLLLERRASIHKYNIGEVIFYQGQRGDTFYVIHTGAVDICIQQDSSLFQQGDNGNVVNCLTEGCYFGQRALMTAEPRAATVIAKMQLTQCLVFSRQTFEDAISGCNGLLGHDINDNIDWSQDHETRSLYHHLEKITRIERMDTSESFRTILHKLTAVFTPELSADEVIARMVRAIKTCLKADRVGLFILSKDRKSMVLKVSERSKGIQLPIKNLAGAVIESNRAINVHDAYQDGSRFDNTMDRRTGYRTRQVLGVPVGHPLTGSITL
jgi:CRP-like cAMP-binding protein